MLGRSRHVAGEDPDDQYQRMAIICCVMIFNSPGCSRTVEEKGAVVDYSRRERERGELLEEDIRYKVGVGCDHVSQSVSSRINVAHVKIEWQSGRVGDHTAGNSCRGIAVVVAADHILQGSRNLT